MTLSRVPPVDAGADEWLVFADELQTSGDVRGELIALNHAVEAGEPAEARDAFVRAHAEQLLGAAGAHLEAFALEWRWLHIDSAKVVARDSDGASAVRALLICPSASELRALTIAGDAATEQDQIDLSSAIAHLVAHGLPASCRALTLLDERAARSTSVIATFYDPPNNLVGFGDLGALWPKLSRIEQLHLSVSDAAQLELGLIVAPSLKSFRIDCLTWAGRDEIPDALENASWPNLETLELRLPEAWTFSTPDDFKGYTRPYDGREDADEYYDEDEDDGYHEDLDWARRLAPLLESLRKTKLRRLALTSFQSVSTVLDAIENAGLPATVVELDLSESAIDGAAVERIVAGRKANMPGLERLILDSTPVSGPDVLRLCEAGLEVVHSEGSGPKYRFLVGME